MSSWLREVGAAFTIIVFLIAVLVVVHIKDFTGRLSPNQSICLDLEGGILITFIRQDTNFEGAKQLCRDLTSELARIDTSELFSEIERFLVEDDRFPVWVGTILTLLIREVECLL